MGLNRINRYHLRYEKSEGLLKLVEFIKSVRDFYVSAGADFIVLEEGCATSISPLMFQTLVLPGLKDILKRSVLNLGLTGLVPVAEIYPLAKSENVVAFIQTVRDYCPDVVDRRTV